MMTKRGKFFTVFLVIVFSLCTLLPVTVMGSSGVSASVTLFDAETKTITVALSENIEGTAGGVHLYNTESGETVQATAVVDGLNKIKITYASELALSTEYAVVFEDGIYGTSGSAMESRYVYFTTAGSSEPEEYKLYDYDNLSATPGNMASPDHWKTEYYDAEHGNAMHVKAYNPTGYMDNNVSGITLYDTDKWSVGFDVNIKKSPASFAVLMLDISKNKVIGGFGFSKGKVMFASNRWWDQYQLGNNPETAFPNDIVDDYKVGEWVNYKAVYDKSTNSFNIYVDGILKHTTAVTVQFGKLEQVRISQRNQVNAPTLNESLMWFDNIRTEKFANACKAEKIRITDLSGATVAAPQTVKRDIDRIEIGFLCDVNKSTLTAENLKLKYNGTEIAYSTVETSSDKSYCIKPSRLPQNGDVVTVSIDGAKDKNGNTLTSYSSSVTVADSDSGFKAAVPALVGADGGEAVLAAGSEIYLKTTLANKSANDETVMLFIMGYTAENSLEVFGCSKIDVLANSAAVIDETQNQVKVTLPADKEIKFVMGTVDSLKNGVLMPFTEAAVLE